MQEKQSPEAYIEGTGEDLRFYHQVEMWERGRLTSGWRQSLLHSIDIVPRKIHKKKFSLCSIG